MNSASIRGRIEQYRMDIRAENLAHTVRLGRLHAAIRQLQDACDHPHTYQVNGGQYTPATTFCSTCGAEL